MAGGAHTNFAGKGVAQHAKGVGYVGKGVELEVKGVELCVKGYADGARCWKGGRQFYCCNCEGFSM